MKRIWIGIGFLVGLLVLGLLVMNITHRQLRQISQTLTQASETESWEEAVTLADSAEKGWQKRWKFVAALADHSEIDTVDGLFAQLKVYQQHKEKTHHAATCAQLSEAITALEENHCLTWYNLL